MNKKIAKILNDLESSDADVRCEAVKQAWDHKRASEELVPVLFRRLNDSAIKVRSMATVALARLATSQNLAQVINAFVKILRNKSEDSGVRSWAASGLDQIGVSSLPVLIELMKDDDEFVQRKVAHAIGVIGVYQEEALRAIVEAMDSADPDFRGTCFGSLEAFGMKAVPSLLRVVDHGSPRQVAGAARAILRTKLRYNSDRKVRAGAATAHGLMSRMSLAIEEQKRAQVRCKKNAIVQQCILHLIEILQTKDAPATEDALTALADCGPLAIGAIESIIPLVRHADATIRHSAVFALGEIDSGEKVLSALVQAAREERDEEMCCWILNHISPFGKRAASAVPVLTKRLKDRRELVRVTAASVLGDIGSAARGTLPLLRSLLKKCSDEEFQGVYRTAISHIAPRKASGMIGSR